MSLFGIALPPRPPQLPPRHRIFRIPVVKVGHAVLVGGLDGQDAAGEEEPVEIALHGVAHVVVAPEGHRGGER